MNLPKLTVGIALIYMLPALYVGANLDELSANFSSVRNSLGIEQNRKAYASTLPNVSTMTTEQHLSFLKSEYENCSSGQHYIQTIEKQHSTMPLDSALEVAVMVEQLCPTNP